MRSADVIGKKLCAERLLEPLCLSFGFEGLDFVTNTLVSPAALDNLIILKEARSGAVLESAHGLG